MCDGCQGRSVTQKGQLQDNEHPDAGAEEAQTEAVQQFSLAFIPE